MNLFQKNLRVNMKEWIITANLSFRSYSRSTHLYLAHVNFQMPHTRTDGNIFLCHLDILA